MAEVTKISGIGGGFNGKIEPIRSYTKKEAEEKMKTIAQNVQEHEEELGYKKLIQELYPNPGQLSFQEILDGVKAPEPEDDNGYILDI